MTVKEIKDYYFKFLKINLKTKTSVSDDYEPTEDDFISGRIFQKYISGDTLTKIVDGFTVIDHKIYYAYVKMHKIEILADDLFPPCGGESKITVNASYSIRALSTFKMDITLSGNITPLSCPVNAIISTDNPLFTYERPYLINNEPNNSDKNNEVNVKASYYFKGKKYEAYKYIIQHINTNSSWLVEEEPTQFISITFSENEVPNKGGIVTVKVERYFTRIFYKKDSCGNKIGGKSEPGLVEDITKKCLITSSNKKIFSINRNIITVPKQPIGALRRESTITARYMDKTATAVLIQKEGGKISYKQELSFLDGSKIKFFDLETSLPVERKINIISKEYKYIDGEYDSVSNTNEIRIKSDCGWVYGIPGEDENGINITVKTISTNLDKNNDREATLTITSTENPELVIKLIVSQQALEVVRETYECSFISNGEYTFDEFNEKDFYFHPYKLFVYENGEKEEKPIDEEFTVKYVVKSSDINRLNIKSINKQGDDYKVIFNNFVSLSIKDVNLLAKLVFYNTNKEKVFESENANVLVKKGQIIDYNYELCFNGHNKFEEIKWINSVDNRILKVNSFKHKMINGIYSDKEITPFKIGIYDANGKEYFDDSFSIKIVNDEVFIFPLKTDKNISNVYTITQKETGEKITLKLTYETKKVTINVPLKVVVYSNNIGKDVWTGENGYLLIDGNQSIKLNPCWLSPNMKDSIDIAYNGIIELNEGVHTFETFNVMCIEFNSKTHKDCNIFKEVSVDKTTKNIILQIKV